MTDKKPLVIGIAGGTCSGKSTLADLLKEALAEYAVEVLHMDSFFKENPPTVIAPFPAGSIRSTTIRMRLICLGCISRLTGR